LMAEGGIFSGRFRKWGQVAMAVAGAWHPAGFFFSLPQGRRYALPHFGRKGNKGDCARGEGAGHTNCGLPDPGVECCWVGVGGGKSPGGGPTAPIWLGALSGGAKRGFQTENSHGMCFRSAYGAGGPRTGDGGGGGRGPFHRQAINTTHRAAPGGGQREVGFRPPLSGGGAPTASGHRPRLGGGGQVGEADFGRRRVGVTTTPLIASPVFTSGGQCWRPPPRTF